MAYDIMSGFNVGQAIGGQSSLGEFVRQITQRAQALQGLRLQAQTQVGTALAQQQALMPGEIELKRREMELDPEKRLLQQYLDRGVSGVGGVSQTSLPSDLQISQVKLGPFTAVSPSVEGHLASEKESQTRLEKLRDAVPLLKTFEQKLNELPAPRTATERAMQIPGIFLAGKTQASPKLAAFESFRTGLRSQVARILGEVGNLSETEQRYAINLLPSQYDTQDTRTQKLDNFYDFISQRISARTGVSQEQALSTLRPMSQKLQNSANLPPGFRRR